MPTPGAASGPWLLGDRQSLDHFGDRAAIRYNAVLGCLALLPPLGREFIELRSRARLADPDQDIAEIVDRVHVVLCAGLQNAH